MKEERGRAGQALGRATRIIQILEKLLEGEKFKKFNLKYQKDVCPDYSSRVFA